jgi:hypothetical protein
MLNPGDERGISDALHTKDGGGFARDPGRLRIVEKLDGRGHHGGFR